MTALLSPWPWRNALADRGGQANTRHSASPAQGRKPFTILPGGRDDQRRAHLWGLWPC